MWLKSEAATGVICKKDVPKHFAKFTENYTFAKVSFLIKLQGLGLQLY